MTVPDFELLMEAHESIHKTAEDDSDAEAGFKSLDECEQIRALSEFVEKEEGAKKWQLVSKT